MSAFVSSLMAQESDLLPRGARRMLTDPTVGRSKWSRDALQGFVLFFFFFFSTGKTMSCQEHTGKNDNYGITNLKFSIKVLIFWD